MTLKQRRIVEKMALVRLLRFLRLWVDWRKKFIKIVEEENEKIAKENQKKERGDA